LRACSCCGAVNRGSLSDCYASVRHALYQRTLANSKCTQQASLGWQRPIPARTYESHSGVSYFRDIETCKTHAGRCISSVCHMFVHSTGCCSTHHRPCHHRLHQSWMALAALVVVLQVLPVCGATCVSTSTQRKETGRQAHLQDTQMLGRGFVLLCFAHLTPKREFMYVTATQVTPVSRYLILDILNLLHNRHVSSCKEVDPPLRASVQWRK
jgi:uncharacterized membrane protein SirB2